MPSLFLIAHAPLATALKQAAAHCFPEAAEQMHVLDVTADCSSETLKQQASAALQTLRAQDQRGEVLVLADVFGATPCNTVQQLADGQKVKVITGVNVPMLWRALNYAAEPLDTLVSRALAGGTQGVMQIASSAPQNQASRAVSHDQNHRHHQQ